MLAAKQRLQEEEDRVMDAARKLRPSDVELDWDWATKAFDVFLSHKITDAKDIVLTWYNAFTALGYVSFLDRISLDAVEVRRHSLPTSRRSPMYLTHLPPVATLRTARAALRQNIPTYVEQTATFIIAVTTNLFVSYWIASLSSMCGPIKAGQVVSKRVPINCTYALRVVTWPS